MIAFLLSIWNTFLKTLICRIGSRQPNNRTGFSPPCLMITILVMVSPVVANFNQIAYDCDDGSQQVTTVDIDNIEACPPFNSTYTDAPEATIQVLQKTSNTLIPAYTCKARMNREACRW